MKTEESKIGLGICVVWLLYVAVASRGERERERSTVVIVRSPVSGFWPMVCTCLGVGGHLAVACWAIVQEKYYLYF